MPRGSNDFKTMDFSADGVCKNATSDDIQTKDTADILNDAFVVKEAKDASESLDPNTLPGKKAKFPNLNNPSMEPNEGPSDIGDKRETKGLSALEMAGAATIPVAIGSYYLGRRKGRKIGDAEGFKRADPNKDRRRAYERGYRDAYDDKKEGYSKDGMQFRFNENGQKIKAKELDDSLVVGKGPSRKVLGKLSYNLPKTNRKPSLSELRKKSDEAIDKLENTLSKQKDRYWRVKELDDSLTIEKGLGTTVWESAKKLGQSAAGKIAGGAAFASGSYGTSRAIDEAQARNQQGRVMQRARELAAAELAEEFNKKHPRGPRGKFQPKAKSMKELDDSMIVEKGIISRISTGEKEALKKAGKKVGQYVGLVGTGVLGGDIANRIQDKRNAPKKKKLKELDDSMVVEKGIISNTLKKIGKKSDKVKKLKPPFKIEGPGLDKFEVERFSPDKFKVDSFDIKKIKELDDSMIVEKGAFTTGQKLLATGVGSGVAGLAAGGVLGHKSGKKTGQKQGVRAMIPVAHSAYIHGAQRGYYARELEQMKRKNDYEDLRKTSKSKQGKEGIRTTNRQKVYYKEVDDALVVNKGVISGAKKLGKKIGAKLEQRSLNRGKRGAEVAASTGQVDNYLRGRGINRGKYDVDTPLIPLDDNVHNLLGGLSDVAKRPMPKASMTMRKKGVDDSMVIKELDDSMTVEKGVHARDIQKLFMNVRKYPVGKEAAKEAERVGTKLARYERANKHPKVRAKIKSLPLKERGPAIERYHNQMIPLEDELRHLKNQAKINKGLLKAAKEGLQHSYNEGLIKAGRDVASHQLGKVKNKVVQHGGKAIKYGAGAAALGGVGYGGYDVMSGKMRRRIINNEFEPKELDDSMIVTKGEGIKLAKRLIGGAAGAGGVAGAVQGAAGAKKGETLSGAARGALRGAAMGAGGAALAYGGVHGAIRASEHAAKQTAARGRRRAIDELRKSTREATRYTRRKKHLENLGRVPSDTEYFMEWQKWNQARGKANRDRSTLARYRKEHKKKSDW